MLLTGCIRPLTGPGVLPVSTTEHPTPYDVSGTADFSDGRAIQATINEDVARGATVSVIDAITGHTQTSARTDASGRFVLTFSNGFKPVANRLYYFEALKGLDAGSGNANAIGGDAARVRTIGQWKDNQWQTLSATIGGRIDINTTTTAVAIVVSLRAATDRPIPPESLIGCVDLGTRDGVYPHMVTPPDPVLMPLAMVHRAFDLVADALAKERDPVRWIQLSSADPAHETVTLPDAPFSIAYLSPGSATALEDIALVGSNFGFPKAENQVAFTDDNGATVSAEVVSVSPDLGRLAVKVPATAVTGIVYLTLRGKTLPGPVFNLAIRDGHSIVGPSGNVYMANRTMGTVSVAKRLPASDRYGIGAVVTGLDKPGALTFGREGYPWIYVACGGSALKVYKADVSLSTPTPVAVTAGSGVANPSGMAFQYGSGDLFITDSSTHALYRVASGSTAVAAVPLFGTALNKPRGISFGPDHRLYIANSGANNVLAVDLSTNTASVFLSGLSTPWGVAFDTRGSLYVSNNTGNSVYRLPVTSPPGAPLVYGSLSSFASIPTPGGMDADATGYLFVADNGTNGIYRINQQAESQQIAFGMNYPTATWVDAEGKFVLTDAGRILKIDNSGLMTVYAEGLPTAVGLVRDSRGNFYTNQGNISAITQIRPDGSSSPIMTQLGDSRGAGLFIRNDTLYLRSKVSFDPPGTVYPGQGEVLEFPLTKDGFGNVTGMSGPTRRLRSPLDQFAGIARNDTTGMYYTINPRTRTLFAVNRAGHNGATLTLLRTDNRLDSPQDLWVDKSTGRIWVACYNGQSGTGGLYVYNSNGTDYADYSASVDRPTHLASDGVRLYVNTHLAAGEIREISLTDGTVVRTIGGFNLPRGFTFNAARTTLYVNEWGLNRISYLDNYTGAVSPLNKLLDLSDRHDIEMLGSDLIVTGAHLYRVMFNGTNWTEIGTAWQECMAGPQRLYRNTDNTFAYVTPYRLHHTADGGSSSFTSGLLSAYGTGGYSGIHGDPTGAGLVTDSAAWSYGGAEGVSGMVTETLFDGLTYRTYLCEGSNLSGLATDGAGTVFVSLTNQGTLYQIANGVLTTLDSAPYGTGDRMYGGISYYDGKVYEAIYTRHWLDEIEVSTKTRRTLYLGLNAPEL